MRDVEIHYLHQRVKDLESQIQALKETQRQLWERVPRMENGPNTGTEPAWKRAMQSFVNSLNGSEAEVKAAFDLVAPHIPSILSTRHAPFNLPHFGPNLSPTTAWERFRRSFEPLSGNLRYFSQLIPGVSDTELPTVFSQLSKYELMPGGLEAFVRMYNLIASSNDKYDAVSRLPEVVRCRFFAPPSEAFAKPSRANEDIRAYFTTMEASELQELWGVDTIDPARNVFTTSIQVLVGTFKWGPDEMVGYTIHTTTGKTTTWAQEGSWTAAHSRGLFEAEGLIPVFHDITHEVSTLCVHRLNLDHCDGTRLYSRGSNVCLHGPCPRRPVYYPERRSSCCSPKNSASFSSTAHCWAVGCGENVSGDYGGNTGAFAGDIGYIGMEESSAAECNETY